MTKRKKKSSYKQAGGDIDAAREAMDRVKAGDLDAARDLQLKMLPVNQAVTAVYGVPGLKAAMDMLGYFGGDPRKPLLPSSEREKSEIETILNQADLLN